jgi:hypothetical protein
MKKPTQLYAKSGPGLRAALIPKGKVLAGVQSGPANILIVIIYDSQIRYEIMVWLYETL